MKKKDLPIEHVRKYPIESPFRDLFEQVRTVPLEALFEDVRSTKRPTVVGISRYFGA